MSIFFVLGWPFEWPVIILVFLPIVLPVVEKLQLGMSKLDLLIWFGALTAVNMQTAYLSPPVAMSAYYLRNVVPQWSLSTIYRGMADYMVIQVIVLALLLLFPQIALWLPNATRKSGQMRRVIATAGWVSRVAVETHPTFRQRLHLRADVLRLRGRAAVRAGRCKFRRR